MEDFGEYTPPDSRSANGMTGAQMHNLYPVLYHRAVATSSRAARRGPSRATSARAGPACTPTRSSCGAATRPPSFGFDGLESAVRQGADDGALGDLALGLGHRRLLRARRATSSRPELLMRWIEVGAVSGIMRTEANGVALPPRDRPADRRPRRPAGLAPLRQAAHPALPLPGGGRRRLPAHRPAADAPPERSPTPTTRRRARATTSSCSAPTCWPRRWCATAQRTRPVYLPARALGGPLAHALLRPPPRRPAAGPRALARPAGAA